MNIGSLLPRHARYRPDHLAVVCGAHRLTFREHAERVNRLANALVALGLRKGDKLAIILPNGIELLEVYRAAAQLGLVSVPLSPLLRGDGLVSLLRDSHSAAVLSCVAMRLELEKARARLPEIADHRWILTDAPGATRYQDYDALTRAQSPAPPSPVAIGDDDVYNIIYSSGTTGQPKGIVHTHYVRGMYCTIFASQFRITPESVVFHAGSLVFNGAFVTLMPAWFLGCTYVLHEKFDAQAFIETVEREQVTHVMMVPSQIVAVMNAPNFSANALRSLRMLCSVGAPWQSVGTPVVFSEMRIIGDDGNDLPAGEIGEIVGRSPMLMPGYYGRPDLTAQALVNGWLHSGDVGYADADGYLHLVDRKKDLIISGGVNVFPKDIEEIAVQHEAVREVAVFGVPHEKWGEAPVAAVILREAGLVDGEALRHWINARVAARYQQVHRVVILDEFPRSTAGKTLKRVLREQHAEHTALA